MRLDAIPAIIVAMSGAGVGWSTVKLSQRGQRDDREQTAAAQKFSERVQYGEEMGRLLERTQAELARADAALAEERRMNGSRFDEQAQRCRTALGHAMETVTTLQSVVRDEIAREAATLAFEDAEQHTAADHEEKP